MAQSQVFESIKEQRMGHMPLYLYPSTLRMVNFSNDADFNKLTDEIEHIAFIRLSDRKVDGVKLDSIRRLMIEQEGFEECLSMSGGAQDFHILCRKKKHEKIIIGSFDGEYFISQFMGNINILRLAKVYANIAQDPVMQELGFKDIFALRSKQQGQNDPEEPAIQDQAPDQEPFDQ